jgi:hypothetical protein
LGKGGSDDSKSPKTATGQKNEQEINPRVPNTESQGYKNNNLNHQIDNCYKFVPSIIKNPTPKKSVLGIMYRDIPLPIELTTPMIVRN